MMRRLSYLYSKREELGFVSFNLVMNSFGRENGRWKKKSMLPNLESNEEGTKFVESDHWVL
jgi:hypothetical protein